MIPYGREGRLSEMALDPDTAHLTHGSYTATPKRILAAQKKYRDEIEWQPDTFFRQNLRPMFYERIDCVAEFMKAKPENIVLVTNVTTAINTVLKSLPFKAGDGILIYTFTYKAVQNTCASVAERNGAEVLCVHVPMKIPSKEDVIERYRQCLEQNPHVKIAVLDHISSPTATLFPVKEIVALCKSKGVMTLVDAAHVPGQLPVDIEELGADFYTGNMHKWSFTPRSCAMLWVDPQHQHLIRPLVTSAGHKNDDFRDDFVYRGTQDYTPMLCVKEGIEMYRDLGGMPALTSYITKLLDEAVDLLVSMWGTEKYPIPPDMEAPFMRSVRLPALKKYPCRDTGSIPFGDLREIMVTFTKRFKVIASVLIIEGTPWVRVCGQFYNTLEEYRTLGQAILTLQAEDS